MYLISDVVVTIVVLRATSTTYSWWVAFSLHHDDVDDITHTAVYMYHMALLFSRASTPEILRVFATPHMKVAASRSFLLAAVA